MNRVLALTLSLIMVMSLVACGNSTTEPNVSETVGNVTETETATETTDTSETQTPATEENTEPVETNTTEEQELPIPAPAFAYEIITEEQNGNQIVILRANEVSEDDLFEYLRGNSASGFGKVADGGLDDDEIMEVIKDWYDSGYLLTEDGLLDGKLKYYCCQENEDTGRFIHVFAVMNDDYAIIGPCTIVTYAE